MSRRDHYVHEIFLLYMGQGEKTRNIVTTVSKVNLYSYIYVYVHSYVLSLVITIIIELIKK